MLARGLTCGEMTPKKFGSVARFLGFVLGCLGGSVPPRGIQEKQADWTRLAAGTQPPCPPSTHG